MRVECALLADSATVREGLIHVLGGGINTHIAEKFPHGLTIDLALRLVFEENELSDRHQLEFRFSDPGGGVLERFRGVFTPHEGQLTLALTLHTVLREPGTYSSEFDVGASTIVRLPLVVVEGVAADMVSGGHIAVEKEAAESAAEPSAE